MKKWMEHRTTPRFLTWVRVNSNAKHRRDNTGDKGLENKVMNLLSLFCPLSLRGLWDIQVECLCFQQIHLSSPNLNRIYLAFQDTHIG